MATGRTISASFLTDKDNKIISLCESISKVITEHIPKEMKKDFIKKFGKISYSRDGGLGVGSGKLQRDAICTRGRQGKAPFSNRNLRWHPLVIAEKNYGYAKEIEKIEIKGEDDNQVLVFIVKDEQGKEIKYPSDKVHELPERYVVLPKHWIPHITILKHWNDNLWTQNSCIIPALEACNWFEAVESYAVLGIAVSTDFYKADIKKVYENVIDLLKKQEIDKDIRLPSNNFPKNAPEIINCPMCKVPVSTNAANLPERKRESTWQPSWRKTKREEGDESSIQIMHVTPLIESSFRHNAKNVRYGHRWCNVSMTDHSLDETLDFMTYIVKAHKRG